MMSNAVIIIKHYLFLSYFVDWDLRLEHRMFRLFKGLTTCASKSKFISRTQTQFLIRFDENSLNKFCLELIVFARAHLLW